MICLKNRKRIVLTLSVSTFVGLTSVLSAKETVSTTANKKVLVAPLNPIVVSNHPVKQVRPTATHVRKVSTKALNTHNLQSGIASYYGPGFHGRRTANGETFNQHAMTAAHRTLPFGTKLKVTNLNNGQSAIVRVNDRGPYVGGRVIDLSTAAAQQIGSKHPGTARVKLELVEQ